MVLAVITNDSMASVNCRREINFALAKSKPFLSVVMEKTVIPPGMELQLSNQQSVLRYNYTDEKRFLNKIETCSYMAVCRDDAVPKGSVMSNASAAAHKASDRKKPDTRVIAAVGIILAALIVFYAIPKNNTGSETNAVDRSAMSSTDGSDTSE